MTLADEDINSKPADDVDRAILGNVAMQVAPPGGQNWNLCKWKLKKKKLKKKVEEKSWKEVEKK